jgi:hypothetical protein
MKVQSATRAVLDLGRVTESLCEVAYGRVGRGCYSRWAYKLQMLGAKIAYLSREIRFFDR